MRLDTRPEVTWKGSGRPSARSASSRLTGEPPATSPSDERRSVSCMTSALKVPSAIAVAVRHTPLTAIESPVPSSPANRVRTVRRTPSPVFSTASTAPRSSTSPVNMGPLTTPSAAR